MIARKAALGFSSLALCLMAAAHAQSPRETAPRAEGSADDWTIVVIDLKYANADEVAGVLRQVLPPTVNVVPYYPTNSLIVSGDPAVIGTLTEDAAEDRGGDDADAETPRGIGASTIARLR